MQMRVEKKAFPYRIYGHFTQQCRFEPKNDLEIKNLYNLVFQMIALFVAPKLGIHRVLRIQN